MQAKCGHQMVRVLVILWQWKRRPVSQCISIALTRFVRRHADKMFDALVSGNGQQSLRFYPFEADDMDGAFHQLSLLRKFGAEPQCIVVLCLGKAHAYRTRFRLLRNSDIPWAVIRAEKSKPAQWKFSAIATSWPRVTGDPSWSWCPVRPDMHRRR